MTWKLNLKNDKMVKLWGDPVQSYDVLSSDHDSPSSNGSSCGIPSDGSNDDERHAAAARTDRQYCLRTTAAFTILISVGCLVVFLCRDYLKMLLLWLENVDLRVTAIIFVVLFIAVSFPMMWGYILLNVAGGYLYGLILGTLITCACALLGMVVAHEVTKRCLREYVTSKVSNNENFAQLKAILRVVESDRGFKVVVLARLTPIPFGLQNGLFAISKIKLLQYLSASLVGLAPTQLLNSYIGTTLRSMEEVLTDSSNTVTAYVVFFSQLILTAALSAYIIRRARVELNKTMEEHSSKTERKDANMNGSCLAYETRDAEHLTNQVSLALHNASIAKPHAYTPNGITPNNTYYPTLEVVSETKSGR